MALTQAMDLLGKLSTAVTELSRLHERVLVAIDGPDCAGKTTVADNLAIGLQLPAVLVVDGCFSCDQSCSTYGHSRSTYVCRRRRH